MQGQSDISVGSPASLGGESAKSSTDEGGQLTVALRGILVGSPTSSESGKCYHEAVGPLTHTSLEILAKLPVSLDGESRKNLNDEKAGN